MNEPPIVSKFTPRAEAVKDYLSPCFSNAPSANNAVGKVLGWMVKMAWFYLG